MAVLFQLFNAQDLLALTGAQLEALRACVGLEVRLPEPAVVATIAHIAEGEYAAITGHLPAQPRPAGDPATGLLGQFFHAADLAPLTHQDLTILQWAIECALARHPAAISAIQAKAVTFYRQATGREPNGKSMWVD